MTPTAFAFPLHGAKSRVQLVALRKGKLPNCESVASVRGRLSLSQATKG
jgi:hypothetical protein